VSGVIKLPKTVIPLKFLVLREVVLASPRRMFPPGCSIAQVERAVSVLEGRWKLLIVHHLFVRTPLRFSELERSIPQVTKKMLIQQLRALEEDGVVERIDYQQVPPKVEYRLTALGQGLEPALNALHAWAAALPARD
jgi:DNA-binding HxlR family transcriptional regulator